MAGDQVLRPLPAAEYRLQQWGLMTEEVFQSRVEQVATSLGWEFYHTHDSRRSRPGYPDLHLWHPKHGHLWRELKTMKGKQSKKQIEVESSLRAAGSDVEVWRPSDLDGRIIDELRGKPSE